MSSLIQKLTEKGIAHPPDWLPLQTQYETIMGSHAYGVASNDSDMDMYGFAIPPKLDLFPHLRGEILGFGDLKQGGNRFRVYNEVHLLDKDAAGGAGREYDFQIYNIVDYFQLCMENNPNMIDSLFTNQTCVVHSTAIGNMVRENKKIFLHLGIYHTTKGYAYSQIHKMGSQNRTGKRKEIVDKMGFDPKFAYHCVRLMSQAEQVLVEGDIDLMRNNEQLKSIRRGEWDKERILQYFSDKEKQLEILYAENKAKLPWGPKDGNLQRNVKDLLFKCLEHHYGDLSKCVSEEGKADRILRRVISIIQGEYL